MYQPSELEVKMFSIDLTGKKRVEYFGCYYYVGKEFKWMAVGAWGELHGYTHKPGTDSGLDCWYVKKGYMVLTAAVAFKGNWRESLRKI